MITRGRFSREELNHLKFLLKTRDKLSEKEATKQIADLIESQRTLPTPLKINSKGTFQQEFKKLKVRRIKH